MSEVAKKFADKLASQLAHYAPPACGQDSTAKKEWLSLSRSTLELETAIEDILILQVIEASKEKDWFFVLNPNLDSSHWTYIATCGGYTIAMREAYSLAHDKLTFHFIAFMQRAQDV